MGYREIDHLLLNVNKGAAGTGLSRTAHTDSPRPGDSVMVSVADRGMLRVLIHRYHADQQIVDGEASGAVRDKHGEELDWRSDPCTVLASEDRRHSPALIWNRWSGRK